MNELEALIILTTLLRSAPKVIYLINHFGSALATLKEPLTKIAELPGFNAELLSFWKKGLEEKVWKEDLARIERLNVHVISFKDAGYPKKLLEISDFPPVIFVKGHLYKSDYRSLAIVGTRQASIYGLEMAKEISKKLARAGFTIVSGLARGVDTAAHEGALEAGRTLAVLGSGLGCIYPSENSLLAQKISEQGAVLSEFSINAPPEKFNFPRRNRIVSAMTMGTILIEAPLKSGAMLTAERALAQGRPLFTIPGRADLDSFKGNHCLIKTGRAKLIENAEDVIQYFDDLPFPLMPMPSSVRGILEKDEQEFLNLMPSKELSIEEISLCMAWPIAKINSLLMSLVLKKMVKEYPGKFYKKNSHV